MGEYFRWMNKDKNLSIDQDACDDFGWMFSIASRQRCDLTEAACTLINGPWRGDRVIFAGDYLSFGDGEYDNHDGRLLEAFGRYPWETCCSEDSPGIPAPDPVIRYRYAINETKREYVDRDATPLADVSELPGGELVWGRFDPVPALFSPSWGEDTVRGRWCLDDVRMSHEMPGPGFEDISACYSGWQPTILLDDGDIRDVVYSHEFQEAIDEFGMRHEGPDIELHGAVDAIAKILGITE